VDLLTEDILLNRLGLILTREPLFFNALLLRAHLFFNAHLRDLLVIHVHILAAAEHHAEQTPHYFSNYSVLI
jgi:hypothetical protein